MGRPLGLNSEVSEKGSHYSGEVAHPKRDRALAGSTEVDFDYAAVSARLGELQLTKGEYDQLAVALGAILNWLMPRPDMPLHTMGFRLTAMACVVNPTLVGGRSITKVAESFGSNKQALSCLTSDFSRRFGVRSHSQSHGWNFMKSMAGNALN